MLKRFTIIFLALLSVLLLSNISCISRQPLFEMVDNPSIVVLHDSEEIINGKNIISYGDVTIYEKSTEIFTIKNNGLVDLHITGISINSPDGGLAASQFILDTKSLDSVLASGKTTEFSVSFMPISANSTTATLYIYSDDESASPYTITITGSGIGNSGNTPIIKVLSRGLDISSGSLIDIGTQQINQGKLQQLTITNNGTAVLYISDIYISDDSSMYNNDFQIISPEVPLILGPAESYNFFVEFNPTELGTESITITINNSDPNDNSFNFGITGIGAANPIPDIAVYSQSSEIISGGNYDFGVAQTNTTSPPTTTFTIKNVGNDLLDLTGFILSSSDFTIQNTPTIPYTLNPGDEWDFNVQFLPSSDGPKNAQINISNNDPDTYESPFVINISGTGDPNPTPEISVAEAAYNSSFDFGSVLLGTTKTQTFTITNNGTAALNISNISIAGKNASNFILDTSATNYTVAPSGGGTTFDVIFQPDQNKSQNANLTITSDDPDTPNYKFTLKGQGINQDEPDINIQQGATNLLDGATYNFGVVYIDSSSNPVDFTIENNGTSKLDIYGIIRTGKNIEDFILDTTNTVYHLGPNETTTFTVTFVPTKDKNRTANIEINSNDPDNESTYQIKLKGSGKK